MGGASFFSDQARSETRAAVADVEAQTSAEIVVAVRHRAGEYRDADYLFGLLCAVALLFVMLFVRHEFSLTAFPVGVVAGFAAGALFASRVDPIRRALTSPARRRRSAEVTARAAFVELGVGATRGRTGVLVLVALFERRVVLVADTGVDPSVLGEAWTARVTALQGCLQPSPSLPRFLDALRGLGGPLGICLPRAADDINELPDEVAS